jgi:hypothetical protein
MRYDEHPGDGDSAVESRPHPLVGYSGSQRVFFIFRPLCKDIGHESRSSRSSLDRVSHPKNPLVCNYDSARPRITITACELDEHIAMQHAEQRLGEPRLVNAQLTSQMGQVGRQPPVPGVLAWDGANYHDLLGRPRRFRFTGTRCVDYASLKQAR